jgi:hypothetical protein
MKELGFQFAQATRGGGDTSEATRVADASQFDERQKRQLNTAECAM